MNSYEKQEDIFRNFVSEPIEERIFENDTFWTLKYSTYIWKSDITQRKWSCNALRVPPKSLFARFLMEGLWYYWEVNDSLVNYFGIDDVIALEYDTFPEVRRMIEECPISDLAVFALQKNLNRKFDAEKYQEWTRKTSFFKLNWRGETAEKTLNQAETFWGHMKI